MSKEFRDQQAKLTALMDTSPADIENLRARVIALAGETVIAKEDECPWCKARVNPDLKIGGMAAYDYTGTLWHQGCVADLDRSTREVPRG